MKRVKNVRRAVLLVIVMLASFIVSPSVARGASAYDATITSTSSLIIDCEDSTTRDLTTNWLTYLMTDASALNGDPLYNVVGNTIQRDYFQGEFQTTLDNTVGRSVTQVIETNGLRHIMIFNNHANGLSFSNSGTVKELKGYATFLRISCQQYGSVQGIFMDFNNSNSPRVHANDNAQAIVNSEPQYRPFFVNQTVTYPSGYEGVVLSATEPASPPAEYVAMGDSFSSGEGNPSFFGGTDQGGVDENRCHRSPKAYPTLLSRDSELDLWPTAFVACSGATTSNILHGGTATGAWNEGSQVNALSASTKVVTLTIGGNDIGFSDYAYACTITLCGPSTFDYGYIMDAINDSGFYDSLVLTYETILESAPNAEVYVIDYPYLADDSSDVCGAMDLTGVWAVQGQLNGVIEEAVSQVITDHLNLRLHYVNTNQTNSPFIGKHLCNGGDSDFNGLSAPFDREYSFHPNMFGQQHYADVVKSKM